MALDIYILAQTVGEDIKRFMEFASENTGIGVNVDVAPSRTGYLREIPEAYHGYLLHLSQTDESAVRQLKDNSPKSKVWGITGGITPGGKVWPDLLENDYYQVDFRACEQILRRLQKSL